MKINKKQIRNGLFLLSSTLLWGCYSGGYYPDHSISGSYYYGTGWNDYPYWYDHDPVYVHPSKPPESGDRIPSRPGRPGKPMQPTNPGQPTIPVRPPSNIGRPRPTPRPRPMPRPSPRPRPAPRRAR